MIQQVTTEVPSLRLIGVDCAAQARSVGIAIGSANSRAPRIERVYLGEPDPASVIADCILESDQTLIALDAPLGWPKDMGRYLEGHSVGKGIKVDPNYLFRRETDRYVRNLLGKQSLDVGADKIARTALAALNLLESVRDHVSLEIPPAWTSSVAERASFIEVYPAATIRSIGLSERGYKGNKPEHREARTMILNELQSWVDIDSQLSESVLVSDDTLDAVVCVLAAVDFLNGRCSGPKDKTSAEKEGWIWVRKPNLD